MIQYIKIGEMIGKVNKNKEMGKGHKIYSKNINKNNNIISVRREMRGDVESEEKQKGELEEGPRYRGILQNTI